MWDCPKLAIKWFAKISLHILSQLLTSQFGLTSIIFKPKTHPKVYHLVTSPHSSWSYLLKGRKKSYLHYRSTCNKHVNVASCGVQYSTLKCMMCECSVDEGSVGIPALSGFLTSKHDSFCVVSLRYSYQLACACAHAACLHKMEGYMRNGNTVLCTCKCSRHLGMVVCLLLMIFSQNCIYMSDMVFGCVLFWKEVIVRMFLITTNFCFYIRTLIYFVFHLLATT